MIAALLVGVVVGALLGAGVAIYLVRHAGRAAAAPPPRREPLPSLHTVAVPYPRVLCASCGFKIRVDHEGDTCVMVATQGEALQYLHLGCARSPTDR